MRRRNFDAVLIDLCVRGSLMVHSSPGQVLVCLCRRIAHRVFSYDLI